MTIAYKSLAMIFLFGFPLLAATQFSAQSKTWQELNQDSFAANLSQAAIERTSHSVTYDGKYLSIPYPMGDVPDNIGVCSDVVIRAYRSLGIDLQELVHKDMKRHFSRYPKKWGLKRTDRNIDHRRVPNLRAFFTRFGKSLPVSNQAKDYQAGDLVTWMVGKNLPHIGIVINKTNLSGDRPLIVHNIGRGPQKEDMLFDYKITGHYRYHPKKFKKVVTTKMQ